MKKSPPVAVRVIGVVLILGAVGYWFFFVRDVATAVSLQASGTIEVQEVAISPEMGGRVEAVLATVGERVTAGQPLVQFDTALLAGKLAQGEAQLTAAQAAYNLLAAGASDEQVAAGETAVSRAQSALDAANEQLELVESQLEDVETDIENLTAEIADNTAALAEAQALLQTQPSQELVGNIAQLRGAAAGLIVQLELAQRLQTALSQQGQILSAQVATVELGVDAAQAQLAILLAGARAEQLAVATAQIEAAETAVSLIQTQIERQTLFTPIDGVLLSQAIEAGEVAAPGGSLMVVGDLDKLTITVFIPEDQYGTIKLGQTATIQVDSYPNVTFSGTVQRIADQAQFTPRNVQTAEGRTSTVFAIELSVVDGEGRLKPGMPADVDFGD